MGPWLSQNWQWLSVMGGFILTNLHMRIDLEVIKVKIGNQGKQLDRHDRQIEQLQQTSQ